MDMNVQERISPSGEIGAIPINFRMLAKGAWVLLATVFLAVVGTYISLEMKVPIYRATSTLQIELKQPRLLDDAALYDGGVESWGYFNTQIEMLRSRTLAERVAERIDWKKYPNILREVVPSSSSVLQSQWPLMNQSLQESLVRLIQSNVHVEHVATTQLLQIHFRASDPEFSRDVANTLAGIYIESDIEPLIEVTDRAEVWLGARLREAKAQLTESERKLQAFRDSLEVVSYNGARGELLEALNDYLRKQREQQQRLFSLGLIHDSVVQAKNDVKKLQKISALTNEEYVHAAKQLVLEAEVTLVELDAKSDAVDIELAEKALEQARTIYAREVLAAADLFRSKYEMAESVNEQLRRSIELSRMKLRSLDQERNRWTLLVHDVETNNKLYQSLLTRYKQLDVAGNYTQHKARVIDFAVAPRQAYLPNRQRSLAFAAFFGILSGVALVYIRHLYVLRRKTERL